MDLSDLAVLNVLNYSNCAVILHDHCGVPATCDLTARTTIRPFLLWLPGPSLSCVFPLGSIVVSCSLLELVNSFLTCSKSFMDRSTVFWCRIWTAHIFSVTSLSSSNSWFVHSSPVTTYSPPWPTNWFLAFAQGVVGWSILSVGRTWTAFCPCFSAPPRRFSYSMTGPWADPSIPLKDPSPLLARQLGISVSVKTLVKCTLN